MNNTLYRVAIVGGGPAGLSAAIRAAETGLSHVLLEAEAHLSNTIHRFQKGKHVMAEPIQLPLRSSLAFEAGSRESLLEAWTGEAARLEVNVRRNSPVKSIGGDNGNFSVELAGGVTIRAETVILAIGLQGQPNKLGIDGEALGFVDYQLGDPDDFDNQVIAVIGAGDSAIETALALAGQNRVLIVNRRDGFDRAAAGNRNAMLDAIADGGIECFYHGAPRLIEELNGRARLVLETSGEAVEILCDKIIARLGASHPRAFLESCGIAFSGDEPTALPALDARYQANVQGLYVIGSLAGYPLIKQALNQGYEVIEHIRGKPVQPVEDELLLDRFADVPDVASADEVLAKVGGTIPLFGALSVQLEAGEFLGDAELISGRRRTISAFAGKNCILLETPRLAMNKLAASHRTVAGMLETAAMERSVRWYLTPGLPEADYKMLEGRLSRHCFESGNILFQEGDIGNSVHFIRSGAVNLTRALDGEEVPYRLVTAGDYVGGWGAVADSGRAATARVRAETSTIEIPGEDFLLLLQRYPELRRDVFGKILTHHVGGMETTQQTGEVIACLMEHGVGEGTDVLLIDESICIRCDNCEKACADTHGGISRLDREAGPTIASIHLPTTCRHCVQPHCMNECPPNAIHRAPNGEVFIDDTCIGCGNCVSNCPYDVIHLASDQGNVNKPSLWARLLFGFDEAALGGTAGGGHKKAVKCDMCKDLSGGPACVSACPTGAAFRGNPEHMLFDAGKCPGKLLPEESPCSNPY